MRCMEQNKTELSYRNPVSVTDVLDDYGNKTGEKDITYGDTKTIKANVSSAMGSVIRAFYGIIEPYDKVIVLESTDITEETEIVIESRIYRVIRISKSLNSVSILVRAVG